MVGNVHRSNKEGSYKTAKFICVAPKLFVGEFSLVPPSVLVEYPTRKE